MKVIQILIEIAEAKQRFDREKSRVSCLVPEVQDKEISHRQKRELLYLKSEKTLVFPQLLWYVMLCYQILCT